MMQRMKQGVRGMKIEIDLGDLGQEVRGEVRKVAIEQSRKQARSFVRSLFLDEYDALVSQVNGAIREAVETQMKPVMDEGMARIAALVNEAKVEASAKMATDRALSELESKLQVSVASIAESVFNQCMNAKFTKPSVDGYGVILPLHELVQASVVGVIAKVEMEAEKAARDNAA